MDTNGSSRLERKETQEGITLFETQFIYTGKPLDERSASSRWRKKDWNGCLNKKRGSSIKPIVHLLRFI